MSWRPGSGNGPWVCTNTRWVSRTQLRSSADVPGVMAHGPMTWMRGSRNTGAKPTSCFGVGTRVTGVVALAANEKALELVMMTASPGRIEVSTYRVADWEPGNGAGSAGL